MIAYDVTCTRNGCGWASQNHPTALTARQRLHNHTHLYHGDREARGEIFPTGTETVGFTR